MRQYDYIIGSGWWCTDTVRPVVGRPYWGSDVIRSAEFHHLWSAVIDAWTAPSAVFLVDSASPVKPPITNSRYRTLHLSHNPGHATVHSGHYCGWMASVLHCLEYALSADADYLVYVEQDVLLFGSGIIEHCISRMRKPLMFGSGVGTPQPLQQSFFIIRKDAMRRFLAGLHLIQKPDKVIVPEWKFMLASLGAHGPLVEWLCADEVRRARIYRLLGSLMQKIGYDLLPIGYGRRRPLELTAPHFYFQHGTQEELTHYLRHLPEEIRRAVQQRSASIAALIAQDTAAGTVDGSETGSREAQWRTRSSPR
jgi:hypothetical protein